MNTTPTPDTSKATARPWQYQIGTDRRIFIHVGGHADDLHTIAQMQEAPFGQCDTESESNAALIVQAVNEHSALCAVAEATEQVVPFIQRIRSSPHDGGNKVADALLNALATLASVRNVKG